MACWVFSNTEHAVQIQTKPVCIVDSALSDLKGATIKLKFYILKNILKLYFLVGFFFPINHQQQNKQEKITQKYNLHMDNESNLKKALACIHRILNLSLMTIYCP